MIQFFVEDDKVMGGHSLRVEADIGQSSRGEVRGIQEKGIAIERIEMCSGHKHKKNYPMPLELFTDEEINIIEQIGLEEA